MEEKSTPTGKKKKNFDGSPMSDIGAKAIHAKDAVISAIDQNSNGEVDIEDVIIMSLKVPGVRIDRASFLQKEFQKHFPQDVIDTAISHNPLYANIPQQTIDKIADEVIKYERTCVSGISTALGMPGGWAMVVTIPAELAQYYGYMLRAAQKLMYLYGFPELGTEDSQAGLDSETMNILIICLGVMYGVSGANKALKSIAKALGQGVEKKLLRARLTKGAIYPIVKSVSSWFNIRLTKEIFSGALKKAIIVAGGIIGGSITYLSFKPCCDKLKASLQDTILSNPNYVPTAEDDDLIIVDVIDCPIQIPVENPNEEE